MKMILCLCALLPPHAKLPQTKVSVTGHTNTLAEVAKAFSLCTLVESAKDALVKVKVIIPVQLHATRRSNPERLPVETKEEAAEATAPMLVDQNHLRKCRKSSAASSSFSTGT